ncbi:MAG: hypothetical protein DRQ24_10255 [Candidatus Latescibacterota bacterium]|nr:MAG: hypothetical protein DRQ24_10255 [Candidatus Latescibacterota bacterium]
MPPKYEIKAKNRIRQKLKKFPDIIQRAESEGFNESDTRTIVKEILSEVLGYDKFFEITSEFEVKGHYADFAIKLDGKVKFFIEVKAIGSKLSERDLFQIQSYSASHNLPWMLLTNGRIWRCYHLSAGSPPSVELVFELDLLHIEDIEDVVDKFFLISKEAIWKDRLSEYWEVAKATSPETIASCLFCDKVLNEIRKEIKRETGQNVEIATIADILATQVIRGNLAEQVGSKIRKEKEKAKAKEKTKKGLPAICFAYVPDPDKSNTWKLRYRNPDGSVDVNHLSAAVAALSPGGFRGRRVRIPPEHLPEVKKKLLEAYKEIGTPEDKIPPGIKL